MIGDAYPYTSVMTDEDTVLEEAMDNLKEAGQRIRATQNLMRARGLTDGENHRDLLTRLSAALAMTEAAQLIPRPAGAGTPERPLAPRPNPGTMRAGGYGFRSPSTNPSTNPCRKGTVKPRA